MQIDKSVQLLSADSGKSAVTDAGRQDVGDAEAEFSALLNTELGYHEQPGSSGSERKSGQEVAALLRQAAAKAEQHSEDNAANGLTADNTETSQSLDSGIDGSIAAGLQILKDSKAAATQQMTGRSTATDDELADTTAAIIETEQAAEPHLWLKIISQSHDFNQTLSKSPPVTLASATINNAAVSTEESLAAQLTGWATFDPKTTATGNIVATTEQLGAATTSDGASGTDEEVALDSLIADTDPKTAQAQQLEAQQLKAQSLIAGTGQGLNSQPIEPTKADQNNLQLEHAALQDKAALGQSTSSANVFSSELSGELSKASSTTQGSEQALVNVDKTSQPDSLTAAVATDKAKPDDRAPLMTDGTPRTAPDVTAATPTQLETPRPTSATAVQQPSLTNDPLIQPSSQTEDKSAKYVGNLPIDGELPIDVTPDIQQLGQQIGQQIPAAPTSATVPGKNSPQTFAQFQKAANAAAVTVQKQQIQSELTQGQVVQELAAQQPQRFAELTQAQQSSHVDTPTAFASLLQTERPISSSGSAMGSSTGQQQQQATSQLFAAKLNDHVTSNEQPPLNLLEPSAAAQLKERVMFQVNQKIQSAEIRLAPEELGSMQIKVQMQQEQLSVQFVVQQAGAKEALEQQMPRLREMLEEQGIELTQGQVSQQREGSADQRQTRERNQGLDQMPDTVDEPLQQQAIVRVSDRMVDYYA